ncbi:hypothetical protein BDR06DRAFT_966585 [Suillus hirtellus]|nr:hypothetical protein BDR06DRAFT_966585 [Suillus hirtellus]
MLQVLLQRMSCTLETKQPELLRKCLKGVLPVCNGQVSTGGILSLDIETTLKKYACPGVEPNFYGPFINVTNIVLICLEEIKIDRVHTPVSTMDMIFQQNDMPMYQTHQKVKSIQKLDVIILPLNSTCTSFEDEKGSKKGKQKDKQKDGQKHKDHMFKNAKSSSKCKAVDTLESTAKKSKANPDVDKPDVTIQTSLYTAEMFVANIAVKHLINFIIIVHDWGQNKDFLPVQVDGKQCHECKIKDKDLGMVNLLLHTSNPKRVMHYGLQGWVTNMVPVTSEALTKKYGNLEDGMVAKIFWGEAIHTSEPEILKKVEEITKRHPTVEGHIPQLLWHHKFTNPMSAIQEVLGVPEPTIGGWVLYILIFRKLYPIMTLYGRDLFDVWHQCILCTCVIQLMRLFIDIAHTSGKPRST